MATERDQERSRSFSRRALALAGMKLGLFGLLGARLHHLQVVEAERYARLADNNRISVRLIAPSRGRIQDRAGVDLAVNDQNFQVLIVAEQAGDVEGTLNRLARIVPLGPAERERVMRDIGRRRAFVPVTVAENLTFDQVAEIEVNAPELPGLAIEVGELRRYPHARSTAHVVGYVGAVSEQELTGEPVLSLPGFRIGKTGAERQHELSLRGEAGARHVEVNAVGRVIRELERRDGVPGEDLTLTLDMGLQNYTHDRLAEEQSAAAVIMDTENGEIFSLVSHPSFDSNLFTQGIDQASWNALLNDPYLPLNNKAVGGQYAPGSTFKMVVALAALEEGSITADTSFYCPGHLDIGGHRFHCWSRGHGRTNLVKALAESCDVWFYEAGRRIGIDRIAAMAHRLGVGQVTGLDLPGERSGLMPTRGWKEANLGEPWLPGETVICSIGQGYVLATPLQLAVMTARLVNGGRAIAPRLALRDEDRNAPWHEPPAESLGIPAHHLDIVRRGMIEVTSGARGTARAAQIRETGMEMGGKTGTSQVRRITAAERAAGITRNEDLPWERRDHALFVGFAPIAQPRYACAVIVEHGGGGSAVAAPIARDLLLEAQRRAPARPLAAELAARSSGQG